MIDLTPLDVRKKKGDFSRGLRGYEAAAVDGYLDLVAERLEELVRENLALKERVGQLSQQVDSYRQREAAMNEALVSAQQLREEVRAQAQREGELTLRETRGEAQRMLAEARRQAVVAAESTRRVHQQRAQFVRAFRAFVERQLGEIELEEERLREAVRGEAALDAPARPAAPGGAEPEADGEGTDGHAA